ncbi:MAG: hypothetical protein K1X88_13110 [Nannocystaceae bacterium]|nr:hypothetical protein [Nannocystaceae bacterium]
MTRRLNFIGAAAIAVTTSACEEAEHACADADGISCIWAGTGKAGFNGDGKELRSSKLYWPVDVTFAESGAYVLDWNNHKVRRVEDDNTFETVIGTDFVGDGDPLKADLMAPGVPGDTVALNHPTNFVELGDGTMMLIAWHNHKLRHFDPKSGLTYVACGRGAGFDGDGMPAFTDVTRFSQPSSAVVAPDGAMFVLDQRNQRIRKIGADGIIDTVVGDGMPGFAGDGGDPLMAQVNFPTGPNPQPNGTMALDGDGRLYFADSLNHRIRRVDFAQQTIETVIGTGEAGFGGDGGPGSAAAIANPRDLAIGPDGRLYFADEMNHRVRAFDPDSGTVETVVGSGEDGAKAKELDDGLEALQTALSRPTGITFDPDGYLYVSDTNNHVVRRVNLEGVTP